MLTFSDHGFALSVIAILLGCSSNEEGGIRKPGEVPSGSATCDEFGVGKDLSSADLGVDTSLKGTVAAFARVTALATSDTPKVTATLTTACRELATALGGSAMGDNAKANCAAAADAYQKAFGSGGRFAAAGPLTATWSGGSCSMQISDLESCLGIVSDKCDLKAYPPKCSGGDLIVSCQGSCKAEAGSTVWCKGRCTGTCLGTCDASGGAPVDCVGICEGTCSAPQPDGTCKGTCSGKCTGTTAAMCAGVCTGECSASCEASASDAVECDGKCEADFKLLRCEGGTLESGCPVPPVWSKSCATSVEIAATCGPTTVALAPKDAAAVTDKAAFDAAIAALKTHLPTIARVGRSKGRRWALSLASLAEAGAALQSEPLLGAKGKACVQAMTTADGNAAKAAADTAAAAEEFLTSSGL
jgi:hypothetical protein